MCRVHVMCTVINESLSCRARFDNEEQGYPSEHIFTHVYIYH